MATQLVFKRGPSTGLANLGIVDGQLIFTVDNGRIYLDNGTTRVQMFKDVIDDTASLKAEVAKLVGGEDAESIAKQIATAVATEKTRAEAAEAALEAKIGAASVPAEGETAAKDATGVYVEIEKNAADIKALQEALGTGDGETGDADSLSDRVKANEDAIATLIGEEDGDDGKSARDIAAEEVAKIVAGAPENLDTLKEIAEYIAGDGEDAAGLANTVDGLKTTVGDATSGLVKDVADNADAIDAEVTRAKAAEKANADAIAVLNGDDTTTGSVAKAVKDALTGDAGLVWGEFKDVTD